jgi:methionyl-tRNA formyltransferase
VSETSLRIVLFTNAPGGTSVTVQMRFAAEAGHRLVGVVTTPGPPKRRSLDYLDVVKATPPNTDVLVTNHMNRVAAMIAPLRPDLIVCVGFPWVIPEDVLALPPLGVVNLHNSLLPKYRGPNALGWAFRNDEREYGLTLHRMVPALDAGPILAQERVSIADEDDVDSLHRRLFDIVRGQQVWDAVYERVIRGDPGEPQDESQASEAPLFEPEWRFIDWSRPARTVHNQVRSWYGMRDIPKGAIGEIDGRQVTVLKTRLTGQQSDAAPGTVLPDSDGRLLVQCGDGPLEIVQWDPLGTAATPEEDA